VLALGGGRDVAFDALLREQDLVLVALRPEAGAALAALALDGLAALGVPAGSCPLSAAAPARALAAAGAVALPALRDALEHAIGAPA
jgi:hypothetical protein